MWDLNLFEKLMISLLSKAFKQYFVANQEPVVKFRRDFVFLVVRECIRISEGK